MGTLYDLSMERRRRQRDWIPGTRERPITQGARYARALARLADMAERNPGFSLYVSARTVWGAGMPHDIEPLYAAVLARIRVLLQLAYWAKKTKNGGDYDQD